MRRFETIDCGLSPASAPALARLLRSKDLEKVRICEGEPDGRPDAPLLDEDAAALLAHALRSNSTLQSLCIYCQEQWAEAPTAATAVLFALIAHPSVREVQLDFGDVEGHEELIGHAVAALLAANAPALRDVMLHESPLGDAGWAPVFAALHHNTHLKRLDWDARGVSAAFAEGVVLPAARVNASLTLLRSCNYSGAGVAHRDSFSDDNLDADADGIDAMTRAERIVRRRSRTHGAADTA